MSEEKPNWWPQNPYPIEIFPMPRKDYSTIVPDPHVRTALSGMLGREFWNIASETIWGRYKEHQEDEKDALTATYMKGREDGKGIQWISVKDGLPEKSKDVLLLTDTNFIFQICNYNRKSDIAEYITHWAKINLPENG